MVTIAVIVGHEIEIGNGPRMRKRHSNKNNILRNRHGDSNIKENK